VEKKCKTGAVSNGQLQLPMAKCELLPALVLLSPTRPATLPTENSGHRELCALAVLCDQIAQACLFVVLSVSDRSVARSLRRCSRDCQRGARVGGERERWQGSGGSRDVCAFLIAQAVLELAGLVRRIGRVALGEAWSETW
jgi:hypothetical protein